VIPPGQGRLVVTLNGPERSPFDLTVELTGLTLRARGGGWVEVPIGPVTLNSLELVRRQLPLADVSVLSGQYDQMVLKLGKARVRQEGRVADLSVPPEGFAIAVSVDIEPGTLTPLFITWDVERAIEREVFLAPAFTVEGKEPELRTVVAYVTNEESGTVSVVDRAKGRVVSTIQVGRAPRGIVVSPDIQRAYVVNGGGDTITVIDVSSQRAIHTANIEVHSQARELAISPRGQVLYVANTALNSVSVIDADSFGVIATVPVGISPVALAVDGRGTRLLVANQGSNTVSLIDTLSNRVVTAIAVDPGPVHIAVDPNPAVNRAFVASPISTFITVLDTSTGQVVRRINVGLGAVASLPDRIPNRLFVIKESQNRVTVFDMALNVEIGSIPVGRRPYRISLDPDRDKLLVVNREGDSVTVVDRVSRRVEATIPVGKRPYGVVALR
jgi:YVTN family beta-propeller protein